MFEALKGEIARQKQLKGLTYEDLGRLAGYQANSVAMFMCGARESRAMAETLAKCLDISLEEIEK